MEGRVVYFSRIKSECCLVKYLEACRIFKTKSGHKISKKKEISFREFHFQLGKFLKTTYRRLRRHPRSKQGRSSSEKARNCYIKDSVVKRLTGSNTLGL